MAVERDGRTQASRLRFVALRQDAGVEDLDLRTPRGLDRRFRQLAVPLTAELLCRMFGANFSVPLKGYRFPRSVVSYAVWVYHRFAVSLRDVEDLLAECGVSVGNETIRNGLARFGEKIAARIRWGAVTSSERRKTRFLKLIERKISGAFPENQSRYCAGEEGYGFHPSHLNAPSTLLDRTA